MRGEWSGGGAVIQVRESNTLCETVAQEGREPDYHGPVKRGLTLSIFNKIYILVGATVSPVATS